MNGFVEQWNHPEYRVPPGGPSLAFPMLVCVSLSLTCVPLRSCANRDRTKHSAT